MRWLLLAVVVIAGAFYLYGDPDITLRSSDGRWADSEFTSKGRTLSVVVTNFEAYKRKCGAPHAVLQRATPALWYDVFAWPSYARNPKWSIPFSSAHSEIGDYFPPATDKANCANRGSSMADLDAATAAAQHYLTELGR